jgi:hypothetical protein
MSAVRAPAGCPLEAPQQHQDRKREREEEEEVPLQGPA